MDDLRPYFLKAFGTARSEFDSDMCPPRGFCAEVSNFLQTFLLVISYFVYLFCGGTCHFVQTKFFVSMYLFVAENL